MSQTTPMTDSVQNKENPMTALSRLIELADAHQRADEYVAGRYRWAGDDDGRVGACAIGCTIRDAVTLGVLPAGTDPDDHALAAKAIGVPKVVALHMDDIFEGLDPSLKPAFTPRVLRSIRPGTDYANLPARLAARFARKLAADAMNDQIKACAELNASLYERRAMGDEPTDKDWDAARQQADAAWLQADAAWQQADAARQQADAARQQMDVAWLQADAARQQADAARQQADVAWLQFWAWAADMLCEELAKEVV